MDLSFLSEFINNSEQVHNSDNTMNYIVMRSPEGNIAFTYYGDYEIYLAFKDYEKIGVISQSRHLELLNTMNTCEWDLKVDYIDGEFKKVEKYTQEEKAEILLKMEQEKQKSYFKSEKELALAIEEDYRLGLENISDEDMASVKLYMKSIQPKDPNSPMVLMAFSLPQRPQIMQVYEEKRENGVL